MTRYYTCTQVLLEAGADIAARDTLNNSLFTTHRFLPHIHLRHFMTLYYTYPQVLLEAGANIEARDMLHKTLLTTHTFGVLNDTSRYYTYICCFQWHVTTHTHRYYSR